MSDTTIAIVALIAALAALLIASGQLLQAVFGTADGYRKCQQTVIGPWSKKTRLKWRWSQMRFETIFATPHIEITQSTKWNNIDTSLINNDQLYSVVQSWPVGRGVGGYSQASWLSLFASLYSMQYEMSRRCSGPIAPGSMSIPKYIDSVQSWDFVPAEVIRPFATTTLGSIAVVAKRLGMRWRDFRPHDGVMNAEGNGQTLTSTTVRSLGLLLQYSCDPQGQDFNFPYVPSSASDLLAFGIVPASGLGTPRLTVGTLNDIKALIHELSPGGQYSALLRDEENLQWLDGFSEILGIASPFLRLRKSTVARVYNPLFGNPNIMTSREGFVIFLERIKELCNHSPISSQANWIREKYIFLKYKFGQWERALNSKWTQLDHSMDYLDDLHDIFDETTAYIHSLLKERSMARPSRYFYNSLVSCQIGLTLTCRQRIRLRFSKYNSSEGSDDPPVGLELPTSTDQGEKHRPSEASEGDTNFQRTYYEYENEPFFDTFLAEGMHVYFDSIDTIVITMASVGFGDAEMVKSAWITMMFRSLLWYRAHHLDPPQIGDRNDLSSEFAESRLPIFIG
ncbi:MAG: hypothetical protein M1814_000415 [Vezdaea aestivalis]|nr:MAG: hypothetical protein M1814_000415 [Vezdaea aestivalis]